MRRNIRNWLDAAAPALQGRGPVLEVGSLWVHGGGGRELADLRPLFPGEEFVGCDMREGPGVDVVANAEWLPDSWAGRFGLLLCLDTIEHVRDAWQACREFRRVLRPGGLCIVVTVFRYAEHDHPHDYWRPTPQGMLVWLDTFETRLAMAEGKGDPESCIGLGLAGAGEFPALLTDHWPYRVESEA